jgi:hypothetical protein
MKLRNEVRRSERRSLRPCPVCRTRRRMNGKTSLGVCVVAAFGGVERAVLIREVRSQMVNAAAMRVGFYVILGDCCMAQSK